jgi:hypothetical protein
LKPQFIYPRGPLPNLFQGILTLMCPLPMFDERSMHARGLVDLVIGLESRLVNLDFLHKIVLTTSGSCLSKRFKVLFG